MRTLEQICCEMITLFPELSGKLSLENFLHLSLDRQWNKILLILYTEGYSSTDEKMNKVLIGNVSDIRLNISDEIKTIIDGKSAPGWRNLASVCKNIVICIPDGHPLKMDFIHHVTNILNKSEYVAPEIFDGVWAQVINLIDQHFSSDLDPCANNIKAIITPT